MVIDRELIITGSVTIPALQNVLAVAASDQNDELAWFSNYGTRSVHIAAPGTSIYSTVMTEGTGVSDVISYANSWQKQSNVSGEYWNTRNTTVSGEYTDLSTALWADTRYPYASGSTAYIQKDFTGLAA